MSKLEILTGLGDKSRRNLITDWMTAGVEVTRARYGLLQGTGESSNEMLNETSKCRKHKDKSSDAHGRCG